MLERREFGQSTANGPPTKTESEMPYAHKILPGSKVKLRKYDPSDTRGLNKSEARARFEKLNEELERLQEELYAAGQNAVLIILQGMDTSGKDATIRRGARAGEPPGGHTGRA